MNTNETANLALRDKVQRVYVLLVKAYKYRRWSASQHMAPLDELILTILSQHTSDVNSLRAYDDLRRAFPTWDEAAHAPITVLAAAIRSGGLALQKAPRIQAALRTIYTHAGIYSLEFLRDMSLEQARKYLVSIKGVGPKTAAIVLLFSLGLPALPVDTHVYRVSKRLGLIGPKTTEAQAHTILEPLLQPSQIYTFHIDMITHGRQICRAQHPRCEICPLQAECDYYQRNTPVTTSRPIKRLTTPPTVHGLDVAQGNEEESLWNCCWCDTVSQRETNRSSCRVGKIPR